MIHAPGVVAWLFNAPTLPGVSAPQVFACTSQITRPGGTTSRNPTESLRDAENPRKRQKILPCTTCGSPKQRFVCSSNSGELWACAYAWNKVNRVLPCLVESSRGSGVNSPFAESSLLSVEHKTFAGDMH